MIGRGLRELKPLGPVGQFFDPMHYPYGHLFAAAGTELM
jgi:hypothetical protein